MTVQPKSNELTKRCATLGCDIHLVSAFRTFCPVCGKRLVG